MLVLSDINVELFLLFYFLLDELRQRGQEINFDHYFGVVVRKLRPGQLLLQTLFHCRKLIAKLFEFVLIVGLPASKLQRLFSNVVEPFLPIVAGLEVALAHVENLCFELPLKFGNLLVDFVSRHFFRHAHDLSVKAGVVAEVLLFNRLNSVHQAPVGPVRLHKLLADPSSLHFDHLSKIDRRGA